MAIDTQKNTQRCELMKASTTTELCIVYNSVNFSVSLNGIQLYLWNITNTIKHWDIPCFTPCTLTHNTCAVWGNFVLFVVVQFRIEWNNTHTNNQWFSRNMSKRKNTFSILRESLFSLLLLISLPKWTIFQRHFLQCFLHQMFIFFLQCLHLSKILQFRAYFIIIKKGIAVSQYNVCAN